MVRSRGRTDGNHDEIVAALRKAGCSVLSLADHGRGVPDLLVGCNNRLVGKPDRSIFYCDSNYLLEIKDGSKPPSKRKLTADELKFKKNWRGQYAVVETVADALRVVGLE